MEQNDRLPHADSPSYVALVREMSMSAKNVIQSEIALMKAEWKASAPAVAKHSSQVAVFGALCAISVLPFLAFLVIGLGNLLGGQHWLSSLIVAIACASIGGALAYKAYRKLKEEDLDFSRTREGLENTVRAMRSSAKTIADSIEGENHESNPTYHH